MAYKAFGHSVKANEDGFTLIELLVVILVIGILSAISVPVFLNQRQVANDAAVESDIHNIALAVETFFVSNPDKQTVTSAEFRALGQKSKDVSLVFGGDRNDFCIMGTHPNGKIYRNWNNGVPAGIRPYVLYRSTNGGIGDKSTSFSSLPCYSYTVT